MLRMDFGYGCLGMWFLSPHGRPRCLRLCSLGVRYFTFPISRKGRICQPCIYIEREKYGGREREIDIHMCIHIYIYIYIYIYTRPSRRHTEAYDPSLLSQKEGPAIARPNLTLYCCIMYYICNIVLYCYFVITTITITIISVMIIISSSSSNQYQYDLFTTYGQLGRHPHNSDSRLVPRSKAPRGWARFSGLNLWRPTMRRNQRRRGWLGYSIVQYIV